VLSGTQDLGTGTRTILAQVAAEALGHQLASVRAVIGDTAAAPYAGNSWGSMTVASLAPAARMAAEDARRSLLEAAASMLGVKPADLETREGRVMVRDTDRTMTFAEVMSRLGNVMIQGHGSRGPNPQDASIVTTGAQFAEVEVDIETGVVRVLRIVAVHDAGRIVNPTLAESQLEGGILQGVGFALFEERVIDRRFGLPLNTGMHDYKIPTITDAPAIDAHFLEGADPQANHVGDRALKAPRGGRCRPDYARQGGGEPGLGFRFVFRRYRVAVRPMVWMTSARTRAARACAASRAETSAFLVSDTFTSSRASSASSSDDATAAVRPSAPTCTVGLRRLHSDRSTARSFPVIVIAPVPR
jgi:hypothetical protein